ncbi:MAG: alpha/beta hydrolase [Pseudomonadota bacterium]
MATKLLRRTAITLGLALALASGFAWWKSERNDRAAEAAFPPVGEFLTVGETRVHYWRAGAGPTIVLLHGAGGNLRDFTLSLGPQLAKTHTVIAFDRPGHGFTDTLHDRGESPAEQAALFHAALGQLGIEDAIIGGFSYGGSVAMAWALNHPETAAGVLMMNGVSNPWVTPPSRLYDLAAGPLTGPVFATALSAFAPQALVDDTLSGLFAPNPPPAGYLAHIGPGLSLRRETLRANGRQVVTLLPHVERQSARYPTLTLPIELVHGADDVSVPSSIHADVLASQVPQARLTRVPGVGHSVHHHAQDAVLAAVARLTQP